MKPILALLSCLLASAACDNHSPLCVDTVLCIQGAHWDTSACACVVDRDAGGCVQNVLCTAQAHWDPVRCACVVDGPDAGCVQNVLCVQGGHWDPVACKCVVDGAVDMASSCSTSCAGGGSGCPGMCSGCQASELCCAWAGGACLVTDAGTCGGNGGFKCSTPTTAGVCPNQCYP